MDDDYSPLIERASFKAILLHKLYNWDFKELYREEVMIELFVVSIPFIVGCGIRYRAALLRNFTWKNRHFYNSVNISLARVRSTHNGIVSLYDINTRTLMDLSIERLIPNQKGIDSLIQHAKRTSQEKPFIEINDYFERTAFKNLIRDHITSMCRNDWIKRDILRENSDIVSKEYIFALIVWPQKNNDSRQMININKKIRVLLIQKDVLEELIHNIGLESPDNWHNYYDGFAKNSWMLLREMAILYDNCADIREHPIIARCALATTKSIDSLYQPPTIPMETPIETPLIDVNVTNQENVKQYVYSEPEVLKEY